MANILFTNAAPCNPCYGGIERVTDILTRELQSRGHNVYYLHHRNPERYSDFVPPAPYFICPSSDYNAICNKEFYAELIKQLKIDIVINQAGNFGDSSLYNAVHPGTPVVSVLHSNPLLNYDKLYTELLVPRNSSLLEKGKLVARTILYPKLKYDYWQSRKRHLHWVCQNSAAVVILSPKYIEDFKRVGVNSAQLSKVISIPNPSSYPVCKLIKEKKKQLLYVGRLAQGQKRPDRLLRIWEHLYHDFPDWELIIVGDGKMRAELEKKAQKLERITFTGQCDPSAFYETASILCLTSNFEGFPMVLPEAMSYGVIPFAFDSFAAVHDIITNQKTGFLIPPYDIKRYAETLRILMESPDKLESMRSDVQKVAEHYSIKGVTDKWEALIESVKNRTNV